MNAPAIALTAAEAEAIARANGTLDWVNAGTFPWAFAAAGEIKACAASLGEALDDYDGLTTGAIHPASLFFDLEAGHPDGAMGDALDRVTQDIRDWTKALAGLAQAAEDAAYVSGQDGTEAA